MNRMLLLFFAAATALAEPPCNRQLAGTFDPPEAATDAKVRQQAIKCGALRICTRNVWHYRWERVAVPYSELAGRGKACEDAPKGLPRTVAVESR